MRPATMAALFFVLIAVGAALVGSYSEGTLLRVDLPLGTTHLQFAAADGLIAVGVFDDPPASPMWWARRRSGDVGSTLARQSGSPPLFFDGTDLGWAAGISHWLIVLAMAIAPAWWWIDRSEQADLDRRLALGHCRQCGYDLRMSPEVCPECGHRAGRIVPLREPLSGPAPRLLTTE